MVAVISCAATAIWLILPDSVRALPALCTAWVLISVVAAESISAPFATDCTTDRITATDSFSAAPNWPISSVPLTTTLPVRSFCAMRLRQSFPPFNSGRRNSRQGHAYERA